MFKTSWLLAGLAASVPLRGAVWVLTQFAVGPLLGPLPLALDAADTALWAADAAASAALAAATAAACAGLRDDHRWAYRLGRLLAACYVATNAAAAVAACALVPALGTAAALLLALYAASGLLALAALRQLTTHGRSAAVSGIATLRRLAAASTTVPDGRP